MDSCRVYVADTLAHGGKEIPYPIIAGLNPNAPLPLGPFLPKGLSALADDEVVLLEWPGSELIGLPDGAKLRLSYFDPEVEGEGRLKTAELTLRAPHGYLPLSGPAHASGSHVYEHALALNASGTLVDARRRPTRK